MQGLRLKDWGLGCMVEGLGFRGWGSGVGVGFQVRGQPEGEHTNLHLCLLHAPYAWVRG